MLLPISWLKEFVDLEDTTIETLENRLFESGFEVEEVNYLGKEIDSCVVGEIKSITKHPDSDHLQICILDCGEFGNEIQIVTGAQNVFVGAKVPAALHGASLAGGIKIKNGKLRGVASNGMLCSGGELGITEDFFPNAGVDGILILPESTPIGVDIKKVVGLDDWVFDISITANRPDCESILGMAREVAAILNKKVRQPQQIFSAFETNHNLNVNVLDTENCPLYSATVVDNIKIEQSPVWLRQRLIKCGVNPINNVVDITNYVLKELGQPMHAFDYDKLSNHTITVRPAEENEKIVTLDEKESTLSGKNLVIADSHSPLALAGIMGGLESGVSNATTTIAFESAVFMRESVRKTSRALGIASDSSHRFEKGVNAFTASLAMRRALNLIETLKAGRVTACTKTVSQNIKANAPILTTPADINKILGIDIPKSTIVDILRRLEFDVKEQGENLECTAADYRTDVDGVPDLAEEVIRIYGYKHITPRLLDTTQITMGGLNLQQQTNLRAKNTLAALGFYEMVTYSFCGEKDLDILNLPLDAKERNFIRIANPLTEDISIMKTMLLPGSLNIVSKNFKKGIESGRLFEIANVYFPKEEPIVNMPLEQKTLSIATWGEQENFFALKGQIEAFMEVFGLKPKFVEVQKSYLHPYRSASIVVDGEAVGVMGQVAYEVLEKLDITSSVFAAEINFEALMQKMKTDYAYKLVTKHPSIKRDIAIVVQENITSGQVEDVIFMASKKVTGVKLFDVYRGEKMPSGFKSLAYTLVFEPAEEPITHEEVDTQIKKILNRLEAMLGAELRK